MIALFIMLLSGEVHAKKPPELRLDKGRPTGYELSLDLDPAADQFSGTVRISIELDEPSRSLWLHASGLEIESASLLVAGESRAVRVAQQEEQFALFKWRGKAEGSAVLTVAYTGSVEQEMPRGVFHREDEGNHYLFTQFEPESARAMVPSFDQPQFKVPWSLTIRVPDGSEAYANTPLLERKDDGDHDIFVFERTLPLPTYLISVAAGPFDVVEGGTAGRAQTPIRYLVPKGDADQADWAVETTGPILIWLEDYFNQPYPYRKLDVVGIPNLVGFGAMEHPGLITFNSQILLSEAQTDTIGRRRSYVTVQAHELAHQWFGNLVTMEWWNDIWLNEGFASWMANKAAGELHPEWQMEYTQVARRASAMSSDSLESARQIRQPIVNEGDIEIAFDSITYLKGQAVLQMFETWIGADAFQSGLQSYMVKHAHGTATTQDFLNALEEAASAPVQESFSTFLDQPGLPLIHMELDCTDRPKIMLRQQRYLPSKADAQGLWNLPVCVRTASKEPVCMLMRDRNAELMLPDSECPVGFVPNAGAAGYYRASLNPQAVRELLNRSDLSGPERVGVIDDAAALVTAGQLEPSIVLEQVESLVALNQIPITKSTLGIVSSLDRHLITDELRPQYEDFIRTTYGPLAEQMGFDAREGESEEEALLRPRLLSIVGDVGADSNIRQEALRRLPEILKSGTGVAPEALKTTVRLAALDGDMELYSELRTSLEDITDPRIRSAVLVALASIPDPEAVEKTLNWVTEKDLPLSERGALLGPPFSAPETLPIAWDFLENNLDALAATLPAPFRRYMIYMGSGFCDDEMRDAMSAVFEGPAARWIGGTKTLAQMTEKIDVCIETTARQKPGVEEFFLRWEPSEEEPEDSAHSAPELDGLREGFNEP